MAESQYLAQIHEGPVRANLNVACFEGHVFHSLFVDLIFLLSRYHYRTLKWRYMTNISSWKY